MTINSVTLVGRVGQEPEIRDTSGGTTITRLSVATDRPKRDNDGKTFKENGYTAKETSWHNVTCFNGLGKNVAKYCGKGMMVAVQGRIHYSQYEKDGETRYGVEIIAESVDFLSGGNGNVSNARSTADRLNVPQSRPR